MPATTVKFAVGTFSPTTVTYTPVDGLVAPVKAGTVVGTVTYDRTDSAKGAVMDIPDLAKFSLGGIYPNYKVIAKVDLTDGDFAVGVAPLPTGGELKFSIAKAPVVVPPIDPPPVAGLPAGAVTAIAGVMKLDAINTGCRIPLASLKASGNVSSTADGQVISGLNVSGQINVMHKNVTVRDCVVAGDPYNAIYCDGRNAVGDGMTVEYCTSSNSTNGISGKLKSVYRCNVFACDNGMNVQSDGPSLIVNNYIHDLAEGADKHPDGIENNGSSGMQLLYNRIVCSPENDTSAVMTNTYFGAINSGLIKGNYLEGGQYTVYADNRNAASGTLVLTVEGNTIKPGRYGPFAFYTSAVTATGNTLI